MKQYVLFLTIHICIFHSCTNRWEDIEPRMFEELQATIGTEANVDSMKIIFYEASGFNSIQGDFSEHAIWHVREQEMRRIMKTIDTTGYSVHDIENMNKGTRVLKKNTKKDGVDIQIAIEPNAYRIHLYIYKI